MHGLYYGQSSVETTVENNLSDSFPQDDRKIMPSQNTVEKAERVNCAPCQKQFHDRKGRALRGETDHGAYVPAFRKLSIYSLNQHFSNS